MTQRDTSRRTSAAILIWAGTALLVVSVFTLALLVLWLYPGSDNRPDVALALCHNIRLPGCKRVQLQDMAQFYAEEMQRLNSTGYVDQTNGITHIPIAEAKHVIAEDEYPQVGPRGLHPPQARKRKTRHRPHQQRRMLMRLSGLALPSATAVSSCR